MTHVWIIKYSLSRFDQHAYCAAAEHCWIPLFIQKCLAVARSSQDAVIRSWSGQKDHNCSLPQTLGPDWSSVQVKGYLSRSCINSFPLLSCKHCCTAQELLIVRFSSTVSTKSSLRAQSYACLPEGSLIIVKGAYSPVTVERVTAYLFYLVELWVPKYRKKNTGMWSYLWGPHSTLRCAWWGPDLQISR